MSQSFPLEGGDAGARSDGPAATAAAESLISKVEQEGIKELGEWVSDEYAELRQIARHLMTRERSAHTLSPTGLVHEAYLRLLRSRKPQEFSQRNHFFAALRLVMSQVLIDHARHRKTTVAGNLEREPAEHALDSLVDTLSDQNIDCLDFTNALTELGQAEPRAASAISLHYFFGLKQSEIAEDLGVSLATVENDLRFAKTWLRRRLGHG
ncbi:MAG: ECF-type sigma factor [Pirellulales bacterium]